MWSYASMIFQCLCGNHVILYVHFSLQMTMKNMKDHIVPKGDANGNLLCHLRGCN